MRLLLELLAAVLRTVTGTSSSLSFSLPMWNRVDLLALVLSASLSLGQARHAPFHSFSHDELARVERAAAAGSPPAAPAFTIDMPIDHFNKSDHRTYKNRYWVNATYYADGGPVFLYATATPSPCIGVGAFKPPKAVTIFQVILANYKMV
jgi:hypothetical protein